jgi:ABC-type multidrug transport system ATPase subunit
MQIKVSNLSKKFNKELIFSDFNFTFEKNNQYALTGSNGSGKSTLLKILSGFELPTKGDIGYFFQKKPIAQEEIFKHISYCAPYQELLEDFTFLEIIHFQEKFKPWKKSLSPEKILDITGLENNKNKPLKQFSSGMRQRVKLALCLFSDASVKLLDEPTSNLDTKGVDWYLQIIAQYSMEDLIIIASNEAKEYTFCRDIISIHDYKK